MMIFIYLFRIYSDFAACNKINQNIIYKKKQKKKKNKKKKKQKKKKKHTHTQKTFVPNIMVELRLSISHVSPTQQSHGAAT